MSRGSAGWLAALRIARRDALRARGRSTLITMMVALPVCAMTVIAVLTWSAQLDPDERVTRSMGAADAMLRSTGTDVVEQAPTELSYNSVGEAPAGRTEPTDPRTVLPAGTRVVEQRDVEVTVRTAGGIGRTTLRQLDYGDPLLAGLVRESAGRAPAGPGEVAVSPALLERIGLRLGDRLELVEPAGGAVVVGVARPYGDPAAELVLAPPGAVAGVEETREVVLYVDTPDPVTWEQVKQWNKAGIVTLSRAVLLDPPPRSAVTFTGSGGSDALFLLLVLAVVGVLAGLEVVLLAGAAFAVGARRQARSLALVTAAGGESRHVRAVVLGGGFVLGAVGAGAGVLAGVAIAAAARAPLQPIARVEFGRLDVRPLSLLAVACFGVVVGLAAAVLPARTAARSDIVVALAGRRGTVRTRRRVPAIGGLLVAAGVGAVAVGSAIALALSRRDDATGGGLELVAAGLIGLGAATAQIGLIVTSPALVGAVGRLGRFLPLAPRLAVRDAARHRSRTAPAVAAVLAGVTGATALTLFVAATDDKDRRGYSPTLRTGQASVELMQMRPGGDGTLRAQYGNPVVAEAAVRRTLPIAAVHRITALESECLPERCRYASVLRPAANSCPIDTWSEQNPGEVPRELIDRHRDDWRCVDYTAAASGRVTRGGGNNAVVGDRSVLAALDLPSSGPAADVLARGGMVVFDRRDVHDGRATLEVSEATGRSGDQRARTFAVPAVAVDPPPGYRPEAVIAAQLAERTGFATVPAKLILELTRLPTEAEEDAAGEQLRDAGADSAALYVERGYVSEYGIGLLALGLVSALVTLGATGVATGLAQADSRPDHATLAAIGASPRLRRRLAMWQATVVAGLGTALGIAAGFVPALGLIRADSSLDVVLPWRNLAVVLVGVPLLAAACAGLFVRSRLPLQRQTAA